MRNTPVNTWVASVLVASLVLASARVTHAAVVVREAKADLALYGWAGQDCGSSPAAAAVNTLVYLQKKWPETYGTQFAGTTTTTWRQTATTIAGKPYMWANRITGHPLVSGDQIWGLRNYLEAKAPGAVSLHGQGIIPQTAAPYFNWTADRPRPDWLDETDVTFDFLYDALSKGQPVFAEVQDVQGLATTTLSFTGIRWSDNNRNNKIDRGEGTLWYIDYEDPYDSATRRAKAKPLDLWEGANTSQHRNTLLIGYIVQSGTSAWPHFALTAAPAPIPEPAALGFLSLSTLLLTLRRPLSPHRIRGFASLSTRRERANTHL